MQPNEYNVSVAAMLRTLADYVEMADGNVKIRIGAMFRMRKGGLVKIPVLPVDRFSATLGAWASEEIVNTVKRYQQATGNTDGQELIEHFEKAQGFLKGLTK